MRRPFVKDLYWFPKRYVNMSAVKKHFTLTLFEDAEQEVIIDAYRTRKIGGEPWIGLPRGDRDLVRAALVDARTFDRVEDRRTEAPVDIPLRFLGSYDERPYQPKAIRRLARTENGVLKSAARTGKCLAGDTLIATNFGIVPIADIQRGALSHEQNGERWYHAPHNNLLVASMDGFKRVRYVYTSRAETFTVRTSTGHTITATEDERFWIEGRGWVRLADLAVGDAVKLQNHSVWRNTNMTFSRLPEEYVALFERKLVPAVATLIAYRGRMRVVGESGGETTVTLNASSSCVNYAGILLQRFGGRRIDRTLVIPTWLWRGMIDRYYYRDSVPNMVLISRRNVVKAYLRALYESAAFQRSTLANADASSVQSHITYCLEWETERDTLASQIQVILNNFGVWVMRDGSRLFADPSNTRHFFETLDIQGITEFGDHGAAPREPRSVVTEIVPAGVQDVYDLSVGDELDPGTHHFVANGIVVHNTVMGTGAIVRRQQKTLILAHQTDLIEQFCNETINDPTESLYDGARHKTPIAGICTRLEDFDRYPICLATYQMFLSERGEAILEAIKDRFGVLLIDEVHRTPADRYSAVISRFSAKWTWGLTATDDRKDGKYELARLIVGPVCYRTKATALSAKVYGRETGIKHRNPPKTWNGALNFLFRDAGRNRLIARQAIRDVRRGHTVLIPIMRHEHAQDLKKTITLLSGDPKLVFTFTGSIPKNRRQWAREQMRSNRNARIHIAMRSMLTGVNIPRWSAIYTIAPISNQPNYEQEVMRVCTPMPGKPRPIIRFYLDGVLGLAHGCMRTCAKTLLDPTHGFEISPSFRRLLGMSEAKKRPQREIDDLEVARGAASGSRLRF